MTTMRSKTAQRILSSTPDSIKEMVRRFANEKVRKAFIE